MDYLKIVKFLVKEVAEKNEKLEGLSGANEKLKHMTIEKDHWKDEALDYRLVKEKEWWAKEKELKVELKETKEINAKINDKLAETRADYLSESDLVHSLEDEIVHHKDKISKLEKDAKKHWATEFAYNHLMKEYEDIKSYYEEKMAKLQVDINHLKNNK